VIFAAADLGGVEQLVPLGKRKAAPMPVITTRRRMAACFADFILTLRRGNSFILKHNTRSTMR